MANVYSIAFTVLGVVAAHCCLLVWTAIVLPGPVDRARRRIETRPVSNFFIGLACFAATVCLFGGFSAVRAQLVPKIDDGLEYLSVHLQFTRSYNDAWVLTNWLQWPLAAPVFAGFIFGGAGFAQIFGIRARAMMRDDRPLLGLTFGALCTSTSYFLPLIGWFVYLPIVGLISIGSGICGMLGRSAIHDTGSAGPGMQDAATRGGDARSATRRQEPILSSR